MNPPPFDLARSRVAIVGLGLMGGSLALALRGRCAALTGIDPHPAALEMARAQDIVDRAGSDPAGLLPGSDLVVLAAPVPAILSFLERLPAILPEPCIVLDLGSTKETIVAAMARLPERFDPLGGHPICGKEQLTLAHAERTLYYGAPFLLTPLPRTSSRAMDAAGQIIEALGARAVVVDAAEHDHALASVSHLPYLLSSALVLATATGLRPMAGPGFRSTARLAGTSSSMMLGVLQTNRENVLAALRGLQSELAGLESALAAKDDAGLETLLDEARRRHQELTA